MRKKASEETKKKMSAAQKRRFARSPVSAITRQKMSTSNKGINWKGDNIKYHSLHTWLIREKGKAMFCELADETCKGRFEWANFSHEYKRDLDDYVSLCVSHHVRYDLKRKPDESVRLLVAGLRT